MVARSSSPSAPKPRHLTIGYHKHDQRQDGRRVSTRTVPFLRMSGDWLQQAGFAVGARVRLQVDRGRIVIEPA
jgi:toxic protein SymE